ncbi:MAG: aminotransferase class I/II-fold pyridoxal phosphate-dependent enzyme [Promethearchaeota archaeon]|nr:MAG: aminotransferase class I/II-fold pyridoxal phosphate-dependent enzyme [Candidatus Lokiarchaeota archaeon]
MKELSQKVAQAPKSKIRELFDLAAGREDVISLGIGQPDFKTPQPAIEGNIEALKKNITHYAPTRGIPALLEQLERKAKQFNKIDLNWKENIIVTNGGSQALSLTFASLFNPGDELILSSPNFISYFYLSVFFGVKLVEIKRRDDFSLDLNAIKQKVNAKTKAILINSPNNPTGHVMSREELYELIEITKKNDLYLISDEVYENYTYDGTKHISPASIEGMFERTITLNAMSKLFSATGFRLGYVFAKKQIIDLMENYHQYTAAGTNHPAQYGFLEALKMDTAFFNNILKSFDERRLFTYKRLEEIGFDVIKPKGAFYIMPSIKNLNLDGESFSKKLMKDYRVAVVPGKTFGSYSDNMIRISYATEYQKLEEAMDRIEKFVEML